MDKLIKSENERKVKRPNSSRGSKDRNGSGKLEKPQSGSSNNRKKAGKGEKTHGHRSALESIDHHLLEQKLKLASVRSEEIREADHSEGGNEEDEGVSIIAHLNLSEDQLSEYREAFRVFDKSGTGEITCRMLRHTMMALGQHLTEAELQDMITDVDVYGNGKVDFEEFVLMLHRRMMSDFDSKDEVKDVFAIFDRDGNGLISKSEMRYMLVQLGIHLGEEELADLLHTMDMDQDGLVCFEEFASFIKEHKM